ncbi:hypothetical protein EGW08_022488 [Elysia chlorotica]|uniref:Uridylate-specific endoribonuclease n=1 Tax=Elysia chlorotica TaxID=188477 RepID=A0A433SKU0_ELYCH|nr:hypothetical protein EGW08_022488 [Elysia chlorotica]
MAEGFSPDSELSEIISKLWDMDDNKCFPGEDYELDLQGYVCSSREVGDDHASQSLFKFVDEEKVFSRPTYKAFRALLDNYEMDLGEAETVTWEERQENHEFLTAIMETEVMKEAHRYLVSKGAAPEDEGRFKGLLHGIWFKMFRKGGSSSPNSSSFEHVFVGEGRGEDMIGLHNWIQFYLQEKAGNIDYHGYFRRETIRDDDIIRLLAVQFSWKGVRGKPLCSVFIGSSPEFEIAAYTVTLLLDRNGKLEVNMGEYEVELTVHSFGSSHHRKLGTAYMGAARFDDYAHKRGWHSK